ncbi:hypothetical protein MTO96_015447 [Rhipicephalus appendiculatus]
MVHGVKTKHAGEGNPLEKKQRRWEAVALPRRPRRRRRLRGAHFHRPRLFSFVLIPVFSGQTRRRWPTILVCLGCLILLSQYLFLRVCSLKGFQRLEDGCLSMQASFFFLLFPMLFSIVLLTPLGIKALPNFLVDPCRGIDEKIKMGTEKTTRLTPYT